MCNNRYRKFFFCCLIFFFNKNIYAQPWIGTNELHLRADIEILSDLGIIKIPITSFPLMWPGIIKDLDNVNIQQVPQAYKNTYWRVKRAARSAIKNQQIKTLRISSATSEEVLRNFGDNSRGEFEISASKQGMSKNFAWNLQVTRVQEPFDKDKTRYDGSYLAAVAGNWIISAGAIEKWWGPSWHSANLLSNNARPTLGITLQRNYSDISNNPAFSWLGHWTVNAFAAELEDDGRIVKNTRLTGASFSFKPLSSLEISLRSTKLFAGDNLPEDIDDDNDDVNGDMDFDGDLDGDQSSGLDLRWRLPVNYPASLYASAYSQQSGLSQAAQQIGLTSSFKIFGNHWKYFIELTDTTADGKYNQTYESQLYPSGYRERGLAIGSTYDNDSKASSLGLIGTFANNQISLTVSEIQLNQDARNFSTDALHSISSSAKKFKHIECAWKYQTASYGSFQLNLEYSDKIYDDFNRVDNKYRVGVDWNYKI